MQQSEDAASDDHRPDGMTSAESAVRDPRNLAVFLAAAFSMAAGAMHIAASQTHLEHLGLSRLFLAAGAAQLVVGAALLLSTARVVRWAAIGVNVVAVSAWALTRFVGISSVSGLEEAESAQLADSLTAALAAAAIISLGFAMAGSQRAATPNATRVSHSFMAATGALVAVVAFVGINQLASHDHAGAGDHGGEHAAGEHAEHTASEHAEHTENAAGEHAEHAAGEHAENAELETVSADQDAWRMGATDEELAETEQLIAETQQAVAEFDSIAHAEEQGYVRINGDHLLKVGLVADDKQLDPSAIESLIVGQVDGEDAIVGGMYLMNLGQTMSDVPRRGGELMVWHTHGGFCFQVDGVITAGSESKDACAEGSVFLEDPPMFHVYTEAKSDEGVLRETATCGTFTYTDLPHERPVPGCGPTEKDEHDH